jgi:hypothetical protein
MWMVIGNKKASTGRAFGFYLGGFPVWGTQETVDIESFKFDVSKRHLQSLCLGDCCREYPMACKRVATAWILQPTFFRDIYHGVDD